MKFGTYLWNKKIPVAGTVFLVICIYMMGFVFKADMQYQNALVFLLVLCGAVSLFYDFFRRRIFYDEMLAILSQLDEKYLITEMLDKPHFPDGDIMLDMLYEINKAMKERINKLELSVTEFKEYLEMWIHEVKVPISSLDLMNYNGSTDLKGQKKQIDKLKTYVEQILFYARADAPEKDYLMKRCNLNQLVNRTVKEQKELILGNKISIVKEDLDIDIISDSKWLEFMLGQIVNNAIKYLIVRQEEDTDTKGTIIFSAKKMEDTVTLSIRDNGIGISEGDLKRVFDKSFTGENGRRTAASTGMGLYICKKLCNKLGHGIEIVSFQGEFTEVKISFGKDRYYEFR
ncbi:MAG: sensor histidine kinase [Clostridium sp.]|nr:sensor histidine kinase [Clostridium sp.]MCM1398499.1 sensor histidine kinase [Clostridium sp.]MCM1460221.1 sensor histidine kinase [Bacteroides sp.]